MSLHPTVMLVLEKYTKQAVADSGGVEFSPAEALEVFIDASECYPHDKAKSLAKHLRANRREAEQVVAGRLGLM